MTTPKWPVKKWTFSVESLDFYALVREAMGRGKDVVAALGSGLKAENEPASL